MILFYESSNGQAFDLKVGQIRTRTANFHDYSWTPKTIEQQYGARVYRFDKVAVSYTALMSVFGSLDDRKQWLNILHNAFDADIANLTPGKIVHGEYAIGCYITTSSTYYDDPFTQNEINIFCPYPFWRKEFPYHLTNREGQSYYTYLDYPIGYEYDYKALLPGYGSIKNDAATACDWKMVINGPVTNPIVSIDGRAIGVYAAIGAQETLVISSQGKTVKKYGPVGEVNLFNSRVKQGDMFAKIASGNHSVLWSGNFDIDLILYQERSEPPWI